MLRLKSTLAELLAGVMRDTLLLGLSSLGVKRLLVLGSDLALVVVLAGANSHSRHIFLRVEVFGFNVLNSITVAQETGCLIRCINVTICVGLLETAFVET